MSKQSELFNSIFNSISKIGLNSRTQGINRPGYSKLEVQAILAVVDDIKQKVQTLGLASEIISLQQDGVGNVFILTNFENAKGYYLCGSHLDSVPEGGKYDGTLGVCIANVLMHSVLESVSRGDKPKVNYGICIWRLEEGGTYSSSLFGSNAAFGSVKKEDLNNLYQGKRLEEAIKENAIITGFSKDIASDLELSPVQFIQQEKVALSDDFKHEIKACIEVHTAQAYLPQDCEITRVTDIRGNKRFLLTYDLDDSVLSQVILEMEKIVLEQKYGDVVLTFSMINAGENCKINKVKQNTGLTSIAGYSELYLNGISKTEKVEKLIKQIASFYGTKEEVDAYQGGVCVKLSGKKDHSGATLNGRDFRKDANLAAAAIIDAFKDQASSSYINRDNAGQPAEVKIDLRSISQEALDNYSADLVEILRLKGINSIDLLSSSLPTNKLQFSQNLEFIFDSIPEVISGAGHDIMKVAQAGIPSLLLLLKDNGISHNPEEYCEEEVILSAIKLLDKASKNLIFT